MNIFSRLFRRRKPAATLTDTECFRILIEEGRKSTYGWNGADAAKLEALWSSDRFPKPSVTFTPDGVFVCPELAKELEKPGNEGLTELLVSMGKQSAATERRRLQQGEADNGSGTARMCEGH
jgi:hypothetical protein